MAAFDVPADAAATLRDAVSLAVLTGAGISAESGVPTFRDFLTGLWEQFSPEELATPEAFSRNPALVWRWCQERRAAVLQARPNPGHLALVRLQRLVGEFTIATQNVDGLHQAAGSEEVLELHGSLRRVRCVMTGETLELTPDGRVPGAPADAAEEIPPRHPETGGLLRPDVVWFGEELPGGPMHDALLAATACDVFLCIGTSAHVYPAAALPEIAARNGAALIEVNTDITQLSDVMTHVLRAPAGVALPALVDAAFGVGAGGD